MFMFENLHHADYLADKINKAIFKKFCLCMGLFIFAILTQNIQFNLIRRHGSHAVAGGADVRARIFFSNFGYVKDRATR